MSNSTDLAVRRTRFRELHDAGCFVLPNAWDVGYSRGLPDAEGALDLEQVLAHVNIVEAVDVPVGRV